MIRVLVIVEGTSEEFFVTKVLAPALWPWNVMLTARILGVPGHKGGRTNYARARSDVLLCLKQDKRSYCSTMLDLYGLGDDFPGKPLTANLPSTQKAIHIEQAMSANICKIIPDLRSEVRFIPYIQVHEYEALLFSDPPALAASLNKSHLALQFQKVRDSFATPEDIDDGPETAPSKRILGIHPSYSKVLEGTIAAQSIGVRTMRRECPHFNDWLDHLCSLLPL